MNERILSAIRSQPWAIMPDYLEAIEAIALRVDENPAIAKVAIDGHEERFAEAVAEMGVPIPGVRRAAYRDGVASLPLFGPIFPRSNMMTDMSGATSLAILAADLRKLDADQSVRHIVIVSDSPGGAVTDVAAFGQLVASLKTPTTVFVSGLCCSAAYWIASQAGQIVADQSALIGSLGVLMSGSVQEQPDMAGNREIHITSSNAPDKRPDLSTEEGRETIRVMIDGIEDVFLKNVAAGRKTTLSTVKRDYGRGGTMIAREAKEIGMIDRVEPGGLNALLTRLGSGRRPTTPRRTAAANKLAVARARAAAQLEGS